MLSLILDDEVAKETEAGDGCFRHARLPALTGGAKCKTYKHCALGWDLRLTQTKSSIEVLCQEKTGNRPTQLRHDEPGECAGAIPAKVLLKDRAIVIAGLANEVDAVNQ
jgi:hypothetical protein